MKWDVYMVIMQLFSSNEMHEGIYYISLKNTYIIIKSRRMENQALVHTSSQPLI